MTAVIEVENLAHWYGKHVCYRDLNFSVPAGRIFDLLDKKCVGKTTLIKILMGFLPPTADCCRVFGGVPHTTCHLPPGRGSACFLKAV